MTYDPIQINDQKIKTPHETTIERYNLTKAGRTADGKMHMDLVAKKRTLQLRYNVIAEKDLNHLLGLLDTEEMFFEVKYTEGQEQKTMTAYVGAIPSRVHRREKMHKGQWIWTDVEFSIIER